MMELPDLLKELGAEVGLPDVRPDAEGLCRLTFDGAVTIDFEQPPGRDLIFLYSVIAQGPESGRERVYRELLSHNLFGQRTGGGVLALDDAQDEILLFFRLPTESVSYDQFRDAVNALLDQTPRLQERIENLTREDLPAAPAENDSGLKA